ncbi:hypothetical protein MRX96_030769 [Rhipicephalus microplus]
MLIMREELSKDKFSGLSPLRGFYFTPGDLLALLMEAVRRNGTGKHAATEATEASTAARQRETQRRDPRPKPRVQKFLERACALSKNELRFAPRSRKKPPAD